MWVPAFAGTAKRQPAVDFFTHSEGWREGKLRAMQALYIARRFGVFLLIVWLAATLNFFLPRLSGQDPVRAKLLQQAALGGYVQGGIEEMTREYERRFGLDKPLWRQYLTYLGDVSRLDFNYSIANYPRTVNELIADALPWTMGLLGTTTLLSFA